MQSGGPLSPEETYLHHLRSIERIAAFVAHRNHLNQDETAEFTQQVRVWLLEDDFAIIRKFEGRASITTYLTTVILRLCQQWRTEQWGKWRPSAEAKRLGDKAIAFERLITRDGYTVQEAVRVLTTPAGSQYTEAELEAYYLRLPLRMPRPVVVSDDELPEFAAEGAAADERVERQDRARAARRAACEMDKLLDAMDSEDRLILQMRYWRALKVPDIARRLHLDPKKVYKRIDHLCAWLRKELEAAGVRKYEIAALLVHGDGDLRFGSFDSEENTLFAPSHQRGERAEGGGEDRRVR